MEERRRHVRLRVPILVVFRDPTTSNPERSFTHDLSVSGIRFPTTVKFQVGQEFDLVLELPYENSSFRATGEVIWIREIARLGETQYEVGLRFRWIADPDLQRLSRFLQAVAASRV